MAVYDHRKIESAWQSYWEQHGIHRGQLQADGPSYYCLEMFPYPSGRLHMGHVRNYSIGDVIARFKRMKGWNVLHPMGWDAFGLPAENAAIANNIPPARWTWENIDHMRVQMKQMGFSYDWDGEIATCEPDYYRWTQWIFLQFFKRGLAYKKKSAVNWCPKCQTVLANEQVVQDACERCDTIVESRDLDQWFFRITDYADRLIDNLAKLDGWPEKVKAMQANWIGRSEGVEITFDIKGHSEKMAVFTTRPDTLFGVTYMVMAPEHPLVDTLISGQPNEDEIRAFITRVASQDESARTREDTEKEGIATGAYAINPMNGEEIPIFLGDYVLAGYGTGSVMAVPAHDQRDLEFARKYGLPVRVVIQGEEPLDAAQMTEAYVEPGTMVNSGEFTGLSSQEGWEKIADDLEARGLGTRQVNYRLRDWLISRQRYWGVPIPVVHCDACGIVAVPDDALPVLLPADVDFKPTGRSPLMDLDDFVHTTCPECDGPARRETDTMDTFVDSSWYFLRYVDPHNDQAPFSSAIANRWMPVDQYIGGVEHAILHLLYARFFTMVLHDLGLVDKEEPFENLLTQGMVLKDAAKMSKSKGNTVDPEEIIERYGADTARLFILFAAPPERDVEWSDQGVEGSYRFLNRVYRLVHELVPLLQSDAAKTGADPSSKDGRELRRIVHQTVKKVTEDIDERFHFNTAISSIMELINALYAHKELAAGQRDDAVLAEGVRMSILLLAPFAPHLADELWSMIGHKQSVHLETWPEYDPQAIVTEEKQIVVQVNGKVRDRIMVPTSISEDDLRSRVLSLSKIVEETDGGNVVKVIVIPGRLVNVVVKKG